MRHPRGEPCKRDDKASVFTLYEHMFDDRSIHNTVWLKLSLKIRLLSLQDVSSGAGIVVTFVVSGLAASPFKLSRCAGKHGFCNLYRKGIAAFVWWSSNNQLEN